MTPEQLRAYCLAKPGAWPDEPWEGDVVAKVHDKIFAFLGSDSPLTVGIKAGSSRDEADEWLARYPQRRERHALHRPIGMEHVARRWSIPDDEVCEAIDASYTSVVAKLAKKHRPTAVTEPGR